MCWQLVWASHCQAYAWLNWIQRVESLLAQSRLIVASPSWRMTNRPIGVKIIVTARHSNVLKCLKMTGKDFTTIYTLNKQTRQIPVHWMNIANCLAPKHQHCLWHIQTESKSLHSQRVELPAISIQRQLTTCWTDVSLLSAFLLPNNDHSLSIRN